MSHTPKGSEQVFKFAPGDPIPDFNEWPEIVRRAHLNQGSVYRDDDVPPILARELEEKLRKLEEREKAVEEAERQLGLKKRGRPKKEAAASETEEEEACA